MNEIDLAVNGTLMRGFALNERLLSAGAKFIREDRTSDRYRLWSINDEYPAMQRAVKGGNHIQVEVWRMSISGLIEVLEMEPTGLCMGRIELQDNEWVFGILGEDYICQGVKEITQYGGWRNFQNQLKDEY
jgi:gamma-glutamylcyclotransferase (GGCT)/AIG2-like uncharacterized protein YtfP